MHLTAAIVAVGLLSKEVVAGARHGHFHKRAVDVVTDWDIVTDIVTDIVWVTVTGDDGAVTTTSTPAAVVTTTPAAVVNVQTTTSAAKIAASSSAVAPVVYSAAAPVVSVSSIIAPVASTPIAVPTTSSISVAPVQTTFSTIASAATTSSAATSVATSSSSSAKRGLSYNDASLLDLFTSSSNINWAYNWASTSEGTVPDGMEYVPMLWGLDSSATDVWSANAKAAIADGATALLGFNEPDNSGQSNLTPSEAAAGYITYMNPFSGQAKLGAPAVTNGGGSEGLQWLEDFISACDGNCDIDFVPIHWYDSATSYSYFKDHIEQAYVAGGNRTLWITEFGATGTDAEIANFLEVVMPWLDEQEYVGRYAYFMDEVGVLLDTATELSTIGTTFAEYTATTISSLIADV